jgi:hypothetical protein
MRIDKKTIFSGDLKASEPLYTMDYVIPSGAGSMTAKIDQGDAFDPTDRLFFMPTLLPEFSVWFSGNSMNNAKRRYDSF